MADREYTDTTECSSRILLSAGTTVVIRIEIKAEPLQAPPVVLKVQVDGLRLVRAFRRIVQPESLFPQQVAVVGVQHRAVLHFKTAFSIGLEVAQGIDRTGEIPLRDNLQTDFHCTSGGNFVRHRHGLYRKGVFLLNSQVTVTGGKAAGRREAAARHRERENHIGTDSWPVYISMHKGDTLLKMRCTDEFTDRSTALPFYNDCKHAQQARITAVRRQLKEVCPPSLYNLTELQKEASCLYGLTAGQTGDIAQSLYEKKLISYPRTAGRHISRDVYDMLPAVMDKMLAWRDLRPYMHPTGPDTSRLPGHVIGDDDLMENPAITVTGVRPEGLDRQEMQVYTLIVGRMMEAFMPPCRVECTTVEAVCAARTFRMQACRILDKGWNAVFGRENAVLPQGFTMLELPALSIGDTLPVSACNLVRKKDLPANPFTDAELIGYMEAAGLGTPATRAGIIRTLIDRKYIRYSGRYIIPTRKGLYIYETVRGMGIANAALTSGWEARLARMERGELTPEVFLEEVADLTREVTDEIFRTCQPGE